MSQDESLQENQENYYKDDNIDSSASENSHSLEDEENNQAAIAADRRCLPKKSAPPKNKGCFWGALAAFLFIVIMTLLLVIFMFRGSVNKLIPAETETIERKETMTQQRAVSNFDSIKAGGSCELEVVCGSEHKIIVICDDKLLPYVKTDVHNDTLEITTNFRGLRQNSPLKIKVFTESLKSLTAPGAVTASVADINSENFDLKVSGSSRILLRGETGSFGVNASGSSNIDASG